MEAVLSCHEAGVLHCDVKPDNFLLRAPAAGAATAREPSSPRRSTTRTSRPSSGRPRARTGGALRARARWVHEIDTYAVGVCLHLIATGAWPTRDGRRQGTPPRAWDRDLWTSLIDAHLHTDPDAGAPSLARRRAFVAATRAALDARRFEDLDAELRRWCRRA